MTTGPERATAQTPLSRHGHDRPRILCVADVRGWIFDRHIATLSRLLGREFDFRPHYYWDEQPYDEHDYDLVYILEWNLARPALIRTREKHVTGIRSHVAWAGRTPADLAVELAERFVLTHAVSARLRDIFASHLPSLRYVPHGVDTDHFRPAGLPGLTHGPLRVGWAGNRNNPGDKGFDAIIAPLAELPDVTLIHRGYADRCLDVKAMPAFYEGIDVYVCASRSEGNNNSLLEAAAMARAIVTTDTGTVPEYLERDASALVVERTPEAFRRAVETLRDHRERLADMGRLARRSVVEHFDWKDKAEGFRAFFLEALERGTKEAPVFTPTARSPLAPPKT